jgi:hypothetical protein
VEVGLNFIFSGARSTAAKVSGPGHVAVTERVDRCATTFYASYDVIPFNEVSLDQSGGHGRLVEVMNDVGLLLVQGLLLADVYLALALAYHRLIYLVLEVHSGALYALRTGSLG